jgi:hypothetical protein
MTCARALGFALAGGLGLVPATAAAETMCGSIEQFNAAMADAGVASTDVELTYDLTGVNPNDFVEGKGSLGQMRNTTCATGQDAVIKVYGTSARNTAHPGGTLKLEYGNSCCGGECGEQWVDPNASAVIFVDGTETCSVRMWINPTEVGYSLACNVGQFDGLGDNPVTNQVDQIAVLEYYLEDGGTTWELPNATATNVEVCWEVPETGMDSVTVPVLEDVTAGVISPAAVFADVTDLSVASSESEAYLKFDVPAIEGTPTRVRLFMHSSTAPSSDGDGGGVHRVMDSSWSETTMTGNTRPAYDAASLGHVGPIAADLPTSVELDPSVIEGAGLHSFAIVPAATDENGTHFWSKEGSPDDAAYLQIDYMATAGGDDSADSGGDDTAADGSDGDGTAGDTGDSGSDGGGSTDGSAGLSSGGTGLRGGETSCGCTTTRGTTPAWLLLAGFVITRRRSRASAAR